DLREDEPRQDETEVTLMDAVALALNDGEPAGSGTRSGTTRNLPRLPHPKKARSGGPFHCKEAETERHRLALTGRRSRPGSTRSCRVACHGSVPSTRTRRTWNASSVTAKSFQVRPKRMQRSRRSTTCVTRMLNASVRSTIESSGPSRSPRAVTRMVYPGEAQ